MRQRQVRLRNRQRLAQALARLRRLALRPSHRRLQELASVLVQELVQFLADQRFCLLAYLRLALLCFCCRQQ